MYGRNHLLNLTFALPPGAIHQLLPIAFSEMGRQETDSRQCQVTFHEASEHWWESSADSCGLDARVSRLFRKKQCARAVDKH